MVLVDACVLAEAAVSDLLFRLSTDIECIELRWSSQIWDETRNTWIRKLGWSPELVDRRIYAANSWFADSMVVDFEHLIEGCKNHPKDRHVLAAAIHSNATHLLTYNTKDFQVYMSSVQIVHPSDFFVSVLKHHPETVILVLNEIMKRTSRPMEEVLGRLAWTIREFSVAVSDYLNVDVVDIPPQEWRRR